MCGLTSSNGLLVAADGLCCSPGLNGIRSDIDWRAEHSPRHVEHSLIYHIAIRLSTDYQSGLFSTFQYSKFDSSPWLDVTTKRAQRVGAKREDHVISMDYSVMLENTQRLAR